MYEFSSNEYNVKVAAGTIVRNRGDTFVQGSSLHLKAHVEKIHISPLFLSRLGYAQSRISSFFFFVCWYDSLIWSVVSYTNVVVVTLFICAKKFRKDACVSAMHTCRTTLRAGNTYLIITLNDNEDFLQSRIWNTLNAIV